ncbi:diaminopimelate epimerase [Methylocystis sp. B8]|uniref:diaminopimelate epimerase n=1 Tax=Methylocystis sp. B8 TaxID=544938 RepID=UPI0010FCEE60|nr:diaminopimelate epimerase [Methylocystis sp. B8]TLG79276.1 diaminopimelate epimerase [Methylocystis sp. B8]
MAHPLDHLPILRMNGAGNEILVLDLRASDHELAPQEARAIANAPGLRFDQLMALHRPRQSGDDAFMRIYNVDGSLSASCGNGTRCVAYALARNGKNALRLETDAGVIETQRQADTVFTVDMGRPRFDWREIPLAHAVEDTRKVTLDPPVDGAPAQFSAVSMGNPHAVFFIEDAAKVDLETLGPRIERHPLFPERVNVSFAQMLSRNDILLRVWERGTGATKACGSAACATLVVAVRSGIGDRAARLRLPGGDLNIEWREDDHVLMTGPVEFEFETTLDPQIFQDIAA